MNTLIYRVNRMKHLLLEKKCKGVEDGDYNQVEVVYGTKSMKILGHYDQIFCIICCI